MKKPGVLFIISGIIFCALTAVTGDVAPFLPIGIGLIIVGMVIVWRFRQSQYTDKDRQE